MSFNVSAKGGSDRTPIPAGVHVARCVTVVDCGLQEQHWKGQVKYRHKAWIQFEIPSIRVNWQDKDGNEQEGPAVIGQMYTASISDKATLGQHLVNWRGRAFTQEERDAFDLFNLLDKACQVSVTHRESNGRTYDNIGGIMGLPAGTEAPPREMDLRRYSPTDAESKALLEGLPGWLQEKVRIGHKLEDQPGMPPPGTPTPPTRSEPAAPAEKNGIKFEDDIPF